MRVGVIAYELEGKPTGVGRYLSGLLGEVTDHAPGWEWFLFLHGSQLPGNLPSDRRFHPLLANRRDRPIVWEQLHLPRLLRRQRLDLLFSPGYSLPAGVEVPTVLAMHDLAFELRPHEFAWRERWRRRWLARRSARRATRLLVPREAVRNELSRIYRIDRERIGLVPVGIDTASWQRADAGELAGLEQRFAIRPPYLLYVGTLLERRNLDLLLAIFAGLRREHPRLELVIAGDNRLRSPIRLVRQAARLGVDDSVRCLGYVDDGWLPALYRHAVLSLYLSAYEGAGLPPLESLVAGTPAVVGPGLVLDELLPYYPYRAPSLRPADVARTVACALADPAARQQAVADARRHLEPLSWSAAAGCLVKELAKAAA